MPNKALWRGLYCLAHPISIAAVMLLLLNDHVLKALWPSWWTGKFSDFAGLVFAPFLLTIPLAHLLPHQSSRHANRVGWIALSLTGITFALIKTVPAYNATAIRMLEALTQTHIAIQLDPTDLLALPSLFVGWYLWTQRREHPPVAWRSRGWLMLTLGTLASLATSQAPSDSGLFCIIENNNILYVASAPYGSWFTSYDGGLSWQGLTKFPNDIARPTCSLNSPSELLLDSTNPQIQYRFDKPYEIDRSEDGGQTWTQELSWAYVKGEPYNLYNQRQVQNSMTENSYRQEYYVNYARAALIDTQTGNVVVAVGHMGVFVRTVDGQWHQVPVGRYYLGKPEQLLLTLSLLTGESWLALVLVPLSIATIGSYANHSLNSRGVLVITWILMGLTIFLFPVGHEITSFFSKIGFILAATCTLFAPGLAIQTLYNLLHRSRRGVLGLIAIACITASLFMLPYSGFQDN